MRSNKTHINIAEQLAAGKRKKAGMPPVREPREKEKPDVPRMVMSVEEMGAELGISRASAYALSQQDGFPAFTLGRRILISREGLQKWITAQCSDRKDEILQTVEN